MTDTPPTDDLAHGALPTPIEPSPPHAALIAEVHALCDLLIPAMPWMRRWTFSVMPVAPNDAPGGMRMYYWGYVKIAILAVQAVRDPDGGPTSPLIAVVGHELAHLLYADMRRCAENFTTDHGEDSRQIVAGLWDDAEETACWDLGYLIAELVA